MKLFIAVFLTSLITFPALVSGNNSISIDVVKHPSKAWNFTNVKAYVRDEGVRVKGYITADHTFGLPKGHVDIAAYSPKGELIAETTSKYLPRKLVYKARLRGKVRFSADITEVLPPNSILKIAFHSEKPGTEPTTVHGKTVAF